MGEKISINLAGILLYSIVFIFAVTSVDAKKHALVFGGNGFIGSATVQILLNDERLSQNDLDIVVVNRGNRYWDSADRIFSRINSIECNRKDNVSACDKLISHINGVHRFDYVIDFSAYEVQDIKNTLELLKNKIATYILISTDSIYDVCEKTHDGPMKEDDDKRPVENELRRQSAADGFSHVIFRLPDVLGPRDTTHRWWIYQLWVKLSPEFPNKPIIVPKYLQNYEMSFVFVDDVAQLLVDILLDDEMNVKAANNVFNLALEQTVTGEQLFRDIGKELQLKDISITISDDPDTTHFYVYPSVRRGPISTDKAKNVLGWKSSPWREVVAHTVTFYEMAMTRDEFQKQRDEIVQIITTQLYSDENFRHYQVLEKLYGIDLGHFSKKHSEL